MLGRCGLLLPTKSGTPPPGKVVMLQWWGLRLGWMGCSAQMQHMFTAALVLAAAPVQEACSWMIVLMGLHSMSPRTRVGASCVSEMPAGEAQHDQAAAARVFLHSPLLPLSSRPHAGLRLTTDVRWSGASAYLLHLHQHSAGPKNGPPQSGPGSCPERGRAQKAKGLRTLDPMTSDYLAVAIQAGCTPLSQINNPVLVRQERAHLRGGDLCRVWLGSVSSWLPQIGVSSAKDTPCSSSTMQIRASMGSWCSAHHAYGSQGTAMLLRWL